MTKKVKTPRRKSPRHWDADHAIGALSDGTLNVVDPNDPLSSNLEKVTFLPRWETRDEKEIKAFRDWWIKELEAADAAEVSTPEDCERETALSEILPTLRAQRAITNAARKKDRTALNALRQKYPDQRDFMLDEVMRKRPRGRAKGDRRRSDRPDFDTTILELASTDVRRLKEMWRRAYGRVNRGERNGPTAVAIAAHRAGLSPETLAKYLKNRND